MWSGDSKYVSVSDCVTPSWDKSQFVLNLNNITSDITVELTLKGDSGCSYAVTANDLGTPEKTNVTPVPSKDATPSGEVFLWKQITLTADNNWSNAVSLEKNDIKRVVSITIGLRDRRERSADNHIVPTSLLQIQWLRK